MQEKALRGLQGGVLLFVGSALMWAQSISLVVRNHGHTGHDSQPETVAGPKSVNRVAAQESYGKLPVYFEANRGQADQRVKFLSRGTGHTLFLTSKEFVLVLTKPEQTAHDKREKREETSRTVLRMAFLGANPQSRVAGREQLTGKVNYFIGNDPKKWHTSVPTYERAQYQNLYPGIDLTFYGNQCQLEYDFVVRPGADPKSIALGFKGADKLEVDLQGDLVLQTAAGPIRQQKPFIYQEVNGVRRKIAGGYVLKNIHQVGFQVASYDARRPLVLDPVLFYSTYLGGSGLDLFSSSGNVAVDSSGNAYVTGLTESPNFPSTSGSFQTAFGPGSRDVFITKLTPTGSGLVYSTFVGGNNEAGGYALALDSAGSAYVTGYTNSSDFPVTPGAVQSSLGGLSDAIVLKLNATGSALIYSTYLGGSNVDGGNGIAVDSSGNAYVSGQTQSTNFPTTAGAFQTSFGGGFSDAWAAKLNPTGTALVYSTYLGGSNPDGSYAVAIDAIGSAYLTGYTSSSDFPTTSGALQTTYGGGGADAFVTKLNPTGSGLVFSTLLGGTGDDDGIGIAVDSTASAYVTGQTSSTNFPATPGAFQTAYGGGNSDGYVAKLNPAGTALVYSTYLGGSGGDDGSGIAIDPSGNAFVTGGTSSTNFPAVNPIQPNNAGGSDAFVMELNPLGTALVFSTYLGGSGTDYGVGIALDTLPNPNIYVTGDTNSTNFPTTSGAFQTTFGGTYDVFVTKLANIVLPPGATSGKVTGGGTVNVTGGIANFGFIVQAQSTTGQISGDVQYVNHASGAKVHSVAFTTFTISGNTATFSGTCTNNALPCTFTVTVQDNDQPPGLDSFVISVDGGAPEGGTLRGGDIEIH